MADKTKTYSPGFQGSETTWVEVIFYHHDGDPVIVSSDGASKYVLGGKRALDSAHSVIAASVNKNIGDVAGSWSVTLKPSLLAQSIFEWLVDDDWVDLVFYRHDQPWHVIRGLVEDIRRMRAVGGNGATTTIYTITGREWSKIYDITPVWFSPYAGADLVSDSVAQRVFRGLPEVQGSPPVAVQAYLEGFLEELNTNTGVSWNPPRGMPGIVNDTFLPSVQFMGDYFQYYPDRKAFNPNYLQPQGTLWQLAYQFSDPLLTELYTDILPDNDPFSATIASGDPIAPGEALMTVVIRDKPFPTTNVDGFQSWWDNVPVSVVPKQQVLQSDIGKSGNQRFNAYFVATLLHQESMGQHALNMLAPLINMEDVRRHGMRRMDVQSQQAPSEDALDFTQLAEVQRQIVSNWYALNPYLLSGTINLGIGRPDLKVGTRVQIPGIAEDDSDDETYYIEQLSHNYTFGQGTRTSIGVTRGWVGDDNSYKEALEAVLKGYDVPALARYQTYEGIQSA